MAAVRKTTVRKTAARREATEKMKEKSAQGGTEIIGAEQCIHCHICRKNCSFLEKYQIDIGDRNKLRELAYHCFLCGKCTAVCPKGIDGRELILGMRREMVEKNGGTCGEKGYSLMLAEKQDYIFRNKRRLAGKSVLFPGCNFPSFYPKTTKILIDLLKRKGDMGVFFDCCGKPVGELGLKEREEQIARRLDETLLNAGVEEVVMVCPNCYDFLKGRLHVRVISIYEKLSELGIGKRIEGTVPLFLPCPDRERRQWVSWFSPWLLETPEVIEKTQCCGLGGLAGVKERELAADMAGGVRDRGYDRIYTYCASCAGNLTRNGCQGVTHILPEILETGEQPDIGKSMINRVKTKFW